MYPRGEAYYYAQYNPRYFQVWGTTELKRKSTDPDYQTYFNTLEWENDWIMLGDYEVVKPSGLPLGQTTNDDKLASDRGFEFFVPRDKERVRYIRFVVNMTWGASPGLHLYEVSLYGSEK
jgi:hypothetical protein